MGLSLSASPDTEKLDALIEQMLHASRVPGAALAIVSRGETIFARGYGYRNLSAKLPLTSRTVYPIASTTKAMNATLLAMLAEEGKLGWDTPVQEILPEFTLIDPIRAAQVTVRDLVAMRTGLPRHDWLWIGHPTDRAGLVRRFAHLDLSTGFRETFQYNNLTSTAAGHLAEVLTGRRWEDLVRERLLQPLEMTSTTFGLPGIDTTTTLSYHEGGDRELTLTRRLACETTAPSGGTIHSTVEDMTRWLCFNLNHGQVANRRLISSESLDEVHRPCMVTGVDPAAPSQAAAYALGWFVDAYQGHRRISHSGYLHDVNSSVMLFPDDDLGLVSFTNFGGPRLANLINEASFEALLRLPAEATVENRLAEYEKKIQDNRERIARARRVPGTSPSHPLNDYAGSYEHLAYGPIQIQHFDGTLVLERASLRLTLEHWHFNAWVVRDNDHFGIEGPNPFDRASRILFETTANGEIASFTIGLEPKVAPIRFQKLP